ncbi:DNA-directed RNA polymerase I subunit RPA2-like [Sycon ciliatum]|uniref:DNA-directed RNA polymerase I subunit RPA2-like n=1 Tax=Sycon ciliatum TaxID=27933 RepID=UPI0031F6FDC7
MLRQAQNDGFYRREHVLNHIGHRLRARREMAEWYSDQEVGESILRQEIAVHLSNNTDKYNMLVFAWRKMLSLVAGKSCADSADSPMNQEILLGGHFYLQVLKEKISQWLQAVRGELTRSMKMHPDKFDLTTSGTVMRALRHGPNIGQQLEYLLATGNLVSKSGLALQQVAGFALMADKLNFYRYLSHFRCVHRGAFFAEMRTTAVRRLLPEAWGFLCPVHTPDGSPCGLLNHLAALCDVTTCYQSVARLPALLTALGMQPHSAATLMKTRVATRGEVSSSSSTSQSSTSSTSSSSSPTSAGDPLLPVLLDGKVLGYVQDGESRAFCDQLRRLKISNSTEVPRSLEIGLVPVLKSGPFPGVYLFSGPARMVRPVIHLAAQTVEMIGSFEQVWMDIAVRPSEVKKGITTHQEVSPGCILSAVASLTPFSDFNQSPRNMYQCQMGKQTMGTAAHSVNHRMDNKLYRLQTPQTPMVRPAKHDLFGIDEYPPGTNAIVCVISYTGYDMEDAMVINKSSVERGFAAATVYKSTLVDLATKAANRRGASTLHFGVKPGDKKAEGLEADGFPPIGTLMQDGMPFYSYIDCTTGVSHVEVYRGQEAGVVGQIKLLGNARGDQSNQRAYIKLRIERNPVVGDKMASRHGQKGVCSRLYPVENMPFSESGMVPDIIFNPHGFPSRMTIGMMIESMAGKSASLHGQCYDATPFTFSEKDSAIDHFGRSLVEAGYSYYGNERFYSGVGGEELEADIFVGTVYYQRLRHMVSDKFQVRTTGPIDPLTHQPVKGRKRAGGIRFGEMERDAMLAHGTSFLLHDRLFHCSDRCVAQVCCKCGSLLSPCPDPLASGPDAATGANSRRKWTCRSCQNGANVHTVAVPYVFRYLTAELAALNINMKLGTKLI